MSNRVNYSTNSEFEKNIGYSRAVVVDRTIFVAGTTGYDYSTGSISPDVVEQAEQTLRNISAALAALSPPASLADVVRARYILPDRRDFPRIWPVLRRSFAANPPAATMMQAGLAEEEMKVEIEVTAVRAE